ncbi:MAG: ATP synthase F1 subunit delta [Chloroflexi bacterium]|nr:ATP synthase F1 subunit delta [Chloroflexota bacterium]
MARVTAAARRYAQAVFQLALEKNEIDRWAADLEAITDLATRPELLSLLGNPKIPLAEKQRVIREVRPDLASLAFNLVSLLIVKGRLTIAGQIECQYMAMVDAHRGIERAEVVTAVPLDEDDKAKLKERLEAMTGKQVLLTARVEPSILGGLITRIGDRLIDGSTLTNLLTLKRRLSGEAG